MKTYTLLAAFDPTEYIIVFGALIGLFFLLREVMIWYWKISTIISNQEISIKLANRTNQLLKEQIELSRSQAGISIGPDKDVVKHGNPE